MQTPDPAYFKVFGLQRTGTNLMRALMSENFQGVYLNENDTGWKHGPLRMPDGLWNGQAVRCVLCVRNPYAWAASCYRFFGQYAGADPTIAPQFQRDPSMSFEEFLISPSYSFQTPLHRWSQMNRLWLATLPPDRTLVVRQEDQLLDQIPILKQVQSKLSLQRRSPELHSITQRIDMDVAVRGEMDRHYDLDRQYMENYSPCLLERVNGILDQALMRQLGYGIDQWCLQHRQFGPLKLFVRLCTDDAAETWQVLADPWRLREFKRHGGNVGTVLDLGAGIGAWTMMIKHLWPEARIHAREDRDDFSRLLSLNARRVPGVTLDRGAKDDAPDRWIVDLRGLLGQAKRLDLLHIGDPRHVERVFEQLTATDAISGIDRICASTSADPPQQVLARLSATHLVQSWTTPAGGFLSASRRQ